MDKQNLESFKKRLINEKNNHTDTVNLMKDLGEGEQDRFSAAELSNYDNHPADLGTEVFEVELNNSLIVNQEYNIKQIDDALSRIEDGTYGKCIMCGKDIDIKRLEALPFARKCIECAQNNDLEAYTDSTIRPVEERVIDAPFGRKYINEQEDDEYEGIDYLNDLMKYGNSDTPQDLGGYHDYEEFYTNEIDHQGIVDDMDNVSNEQYKNQLPD